MAPVVGPSSMAEAGAHEKAAAPIGLGAAAAHNLKRAAAQAAAHNLNQVAAQNLKQAPGRASSEAPPPGLATIAAAMAAASGPDARNAASSVDNS